MEFMFVIDSTLLKVCGKKLMIISRIHVTSKHGFIRFISVSVLKSV